MVLLCLHGCGMAAFHLYEGRGYLTSIALGMAHPPVTIQRTQMGLLAQFFMFCIAWSVVVSLFPLSISMMQQHSRSWAALDRLNFLTPAMFYPGLPKAAPAGESEGKADAAEGRAGRIADSNKNAVDMMIDPAHPPSSALMPRNRMAAIMDKNAPAELVMRAFKGFSSGWNNHFDE